jgi:hypothetical protein
MAGESVAKAAARCKVAYTTAFRWRHRFLMAPAHDKPTRQVGIVEADETFILESFKGRRAGLPRASRKRRQTQENLFIRRANPRVGCTRPHRRDD